MVRMSLKRFMLVRVGRLITLPIRRQIRHFEAACEHPESTQLRLLHAILARQRDTAFGRDHGFGKMADLADFRRQVPIAPYERVAPYIERVQNGEINALLSDRRVHLFALTSGTTASRKLIP